MPWFMRTERTLLSLQPYCCLYLYRRLQRRPLRIVCFETATRYVVYFYTKIPLIINKKYINSLTFNLSLVPEQGPIDLCNPSPCGSNAECNNGQCTCLLEYHGDPFIACRPECTLSSDCQRDQICVRKKCVNPCPSTCGPNAICEVVNHIPMCSCPTGYTGNSFVSCNVLQGKYFIRIYYNTKLQLC